MDETVTAWNELGKTDRWVIHIIIRKFLSMYLMDPKSSSSSISFDMAMVTCNRHFFITGIIRGLEKCGTRVLLPSPNRIN